MKRLSEELKRMLNALALQDVGDYLPMREKLSALGISNPSEKSRTPLGEPPSPPRRVALVSDGDGGDEVLHFAVEACERQQATLDLVLYGCGRGEAQRLRALLARRGIAHELILLGEESVDALAEYLYARRTLVYLVAPADDQLVRQLADEMLPSRGGRLHLPMVLVERRTAPRSTVINRFNRSHAA